MTQATCQPGQTIHIDAHTSPGAPVNTIVVTRNGVDMTVSFAGPTYTGLPDSTTVEWYTLAPVTLECLASTAAGTPAAATLSVPAAGALPFTGGYEIPALLLGGAVLLAAAPFLWGARKLARV